MKPSAVIPDPTQVKDDTPLRLDVAAAIAFPDKSLTANGLRTESERGRLVIERIAGKDYTTLAHIRSMREQCRREAKARDSGCAKHDAEASLVPSATTPPGSSETEAISKALDAARVTVQELKKPSRHTSRTSTSPRRPKARVLRFRSPSPTS